MAKNRRSGSPDRKRTTIDPFEHLVTPLGRDPAETPDYSPAGPVEERRPTGGRASNSESARNARRGD